MAEQSIQIKLKINFPVILITVLFLHLFLFFFNSIPSFKNIAKNDEQTVLKVRRVKTQKVEHAQIKATESVVDAGKAVKKSDAKSPVSLRDLAIGGGKPQAAQVAQQRPGTRPAVTARSSQDMNRISLKSQEFRDYSKSFPSGGLAITDMIADTQKISDAVVSIEVPDGIEPDELNEYELKFYGFQKRTAINYINSILRNLDKFQKKHPRYKIPTNGRIIMTARLTYDPQGNVQQIKMIRWTHVNEIQTLFEDVVKGMDQLHNPPKALWEKNGEFSMYYTLEILNG